MSISFVSSKLHTFSLLPLQIKVYLGNIMLVRDTSFPHVIVKPKYSKSCHVLRWNRKIKYCPNMKEHPHVILIPAFNENCEEWLETKEQSCHSPPLGNARIWEEKINNACYRKGMNLSKEKKWRMTTVSACQKIKGVYGAKQGKRGINPGYKLYHKH